MHKYVLMGVQGCGKGTQAKLLSDDFDLVHISVGDIFRWHIQQHTKLAARVQRGISAGQLVDDDLVQEIVRGRLSEHDWNYGFILDGYPRNMVQAGFFLEGYDIDAVIHVQVPDDVVRERVLARCLCDGCGQDYNLIHNPPVVEDQCDVCGAALVRRPDDNEQAVSDRLSDYHSQTEPVLELFRRKGPVIDVDGTQSIDDVQNEIRSKLDLTPYVPGESAS